MREWERSSHLTPNKRAIPFRPIDCLDLVKEAIWSILASINDEKINHHAIVMILHKHDHYFTLRFTMCATNVCVITWNT